LLIDKISEISGQRFFLNQTIFEAQFCTKP